MTLSPKLWAAIGAGLIIIALVVALLATRETLAARTAARDVANAKLAVSNASVGRLSAELGKALAQQQALAQDDEARVQASREAMKVAEAASAVRQAAIDRLMASAGSVKPQPAVEVTPAGCQVSEAVEAVWK